MLPLIDPFVSELVVAEVGKGDDEAALLRLQKIEPFPRLNITEDVDELAQLYFSKLGLPDRALADAFHMALATWHGIDYLVSWNCRHIASGRVQRILVEENGKIGYETPILCTREELMEV